METKQTKVSVIIPVYNVEAYLEECLDSVICQTLKNYEIICVNDASPDNSLNILRKYRENHGNLRIIEHKENRGLSVARNTGLNEAKGKYIFFLDSDDMLEDKSTLEKLYVLAEEKQVEMLYYNFVKYYEDGLRDVVVKNNDVWNQLLSGKQWFVSCCQQKQIQLAACRQFCSRKFLEQNNIWFYEGILHEDMLFSFLCAMKAKRVMETEKVCYVYRQRENSIVATYSKHRAQSMFVVLSELYSYWLFHDFTKEENEAIEYYFGLLYKAYKKYRHYALGDTELNCGKYAEKLMYGLLKREQKITFSAEQLKAILGAKEIILYGAGVVAEDVIYSLKNLGLEIKYLAVTEASKNHKELYGIEVKEISTLLEYKDTAAIVISVKKQFVEEIMQSLEAAGFKNIVTMKYKE